MYTFGHVVSPWVVHHDSCNVIASHGSQMEKMAKLCFLRQIAMTACGNGNVEGSVVFQGYFLIAHGLVVICSHIYVYSIVGFRKIYVRHFFLNSLFRFFNGAKSGRGGGGYPNS